MQACIAIVRSVAGEAQLFEVIPGIRVNRRYYLYGVMVTGDELHVMNVEGWWRQVSAEETEVIAAVRAYFVGVANYTESRTKTDI